MPWTRSFDAFTEASQDAKSFERLKELLVGALRSYDWDHINFTVLRDDELPSKHTGFGIISTYTQAWQDYYADRQLHLIDPVARCAIANTPPFRWKDLPRQLPLSTKQLKFLRRADSAGMRNGIGIPFPGPPPQRGGIALATSQRRLAKATNIDLIAAYCVQFYKCYKRMNGAKPPEWPPVCHLTPREKEVMLMVLHNRTSQEIARSMNIAVDTVSGHLHEVYLKLGVSGRLEAALICERYGLLR